MKCFAIVILLAAGVLSAPRFDWGSLERLVNSQESECGDVERLNGRATTIFDYEGETRNTIKGATPDDTGLLIKARIYIHPLGACQFNMLVNEVELFTKSKNQNEFKAARESVKFNRELQAQELKFKVSNGQITKLIPSTSESIHVLNIKRGILSTLQLGKPTTTEEVDVNGRCKVNIVEKDGSIVKSKNISECSERVLNEVGYQTTSFEKNDLPIKPLDSKSVCKYTVLKNKIRSVDCQEMHIFRPFSAGYEATSGAITIVKQKLTFQGEKSGYIKDNVATESAGVSLIYQHEKEEIKPDKNIVRRCDQIMTNLVKNNKVSNLATKQSSAHDFTKLVELLRKLNRKTMVPVWDTYFDCERSRLCNVGDPIKEVYRQYLLDALTYCGTETCVYTVHNVIVDGEIGRETMNSFLQGIALVAKPTKAMIRDVLNIAKKRPSRQSFLTLGTLMHRYCSGNMAGCAYDATNPITHAELFLENKLGKDCSGQENDEKVEEILMALKAIGNAGRPTRSWQKLLYCAQTSTHQNISVAALDALRRMPCNNDIQNSLHQLHENINLDPETRIHVYLSLMRCPTETTLRRVVEELGKVKSRQVGSFMASHFKNLNESSDPRHQKTQKILSAILKKETLANFDLDMTKYSRAFEGSVHSEWLKSGASLESHLIFSPDSYIPRSALLNMTATILNVPVNVLEMAARVEGLETLLEDFFGPDGYFPDNNILKIFNITFTKDDISKLRTRREVKDDTLDENIAELHKKINRQRTRPSGNLNVKVFGHEMRVFSYDDIFWAVDQIDNMNVIELLLKFAKGGHKTFTKSMLFLEMTHCVPTGLGFPLKLKLTGSSVASLELNGKVDIRNMFWGPSSMEIKGYVRPSAVVELSGQMGIHSHYVDTGIFVNSSMFTSQTLKGAVIYKEGQTLQIKLDAPEEPNQIFNVASTPFLFLNEEATLVKGAPRRITPDFCLNATTVLGLGLCTKLSLPVAFREYESPYFPLSGPASFGMKLIKSDLKLTSYQLSVNLKKINTAGQKQFLGWFEVGTPGATYSRRLAGIVKYVETRATRTLTVGSFEGGMVKDEMIKNKIEFMVSYHNDTNRFEMDLRSNLVTKKTFKMKFLYFNDTHFLGRQMGVLMSAEYDWYKFNHMVKFVKKTTSYMFQSKTIYWPKKHVTSEIEFVPATKSITIRFDANQINQSVELVGKYTKTNTEKGLRFTATHLSTMKKTAFYVGILNEKTAKKLIINGTALGKKAEISWGFFNKVSSKKFIISATALEKNAEFTWGYYAKDILRQLRFDVNIVGKKAALFADYTKITNTIGGVTIGGTVGKNKIGISTKYVKKDYSFDREVCSFIFYNDKEPVKTCLALKKVPSSWTTSEYKRLTWTTTILSKSGSIAFDYKNNNGKYGLSTTALYGDRIIFANNMELMYESIWNTVLKMSMDVGKKTVSTKFFSTMHSKDLRTFGIEARGFNKMLKLMATYSKETKDNTAIHGVILEAWVNEKQLPVSHSIILELGKNTNGISSIVKIKSYTVKNSLLWIQPEANKYSVVSELVVSKADFVIFKNKVTEILVWSDAQKAYKQMWEFTIWNKKFEYGWDATYENPSTASKQVHAVTIGINYARNRRSSITTTLSNSDYAIKVLIDVEYLPHRHVSHVIRFHKEARQLDVILEFLPKMFVKFMGRLDKVDGWRLKTDVTFDWVNYKRELQWMTSYINRADTKGLSFQFNAFGKSFYSGLEVNQRTKTAVFTISAFRRSLKLVGYWLRHRGVAGVRILTENTGNTLSQTELLEALATYNKDNGGMSFELKTPSKRLLQTVYAYDKYYKVASLELVAFERSLVKLSGEYKKYTQTVVFQTFIVGKKRFQIVGKYNEEDKTVILNLDALKKNINIGFAAKWDAEKKQVSFSTEALNRIVGFVVRLDPTKYLSSFHVFYEKNLVGWTAYLDKKNKALVYNITLSPRLSGQVALEIIKDHIIKLTLQHKIGVKIINETTLKYELTRGSSKFALQWNVDTIKTVQNIITPMIEAAIKNVAALAKKVNLNDVKLLANDVKAIAKHVNTLTKDAGTRAKTLSREFIRDVAAKVLAIINKGDEHFDKFDFIAARDKIGEIAVSLLKKSAKLSSVGLKTTSKLLTKTHENLPALVEQIRKIIIATMTETRKIITFTLEQSQMISKEARDIARIIYKVAKNLTESGAPVVKTAIKLAKEFRIRGRTMEQIVKQVLDLVENLSKTWKKNMEAQLKELKKNMEVQLKDLKKNMEVQLKELKKNMAVQLKEIKKNIVEYVKEVPIPYRSEKVGEMYAKIVEKIGKMYEKIIADLMTRTENFNWEKTGKKIIKMALKYEIKGQPIKEHIITLKKKAAAVAKDLPEIIKKATVELIGKIRFHMKKTQATLKKTLKKTQATLKKYMNNVQLFSLPLIRLMKKIDASTYRHFSPLLRAAVKKLKSFSTSEFSKIYKPLKLKVTELGKLIEKFFMPLLRPIQPLYEDLKNQVRAIHLLEQEIGAIFDKFVEDFKTKSEVELKQLKHNFNIIIQKSKVAINSLIEMTPEEIVVATVDKTVIYGKETIDYLKMLYKSRMEIKEELKVKLDEAVKIAKLAYGIATSKSGRDLTIKAFVKAYELLIQTLKETALVIDQMSMIDVIRPLENYWQKLDLLNHFRRFGVNDMIMAAISDSKAVNITQVLFKAIQKLKATMLKLKEVVAVAYSKTEKQMTEMSGKALEVYKYIRSIPKTEFEELFAEVESFLKSKLEIKKIQNILIDTYLIGLNRFREVSVLLRHLYAGYYNTYYNTYGAPVKAWYFDTKAAALMVYEENKDDTIKVYNYYSAIIVGMTKATYSEYKTVIMRLSKENYQQLLTKVENKYDEVNKQVIALYNRYADQTWEEIGEHLAKIYGADIGAIINYGQKQSQIILKLTNEKLEIVKVFTKKMMKLTEDFYKKNEILTKKAITKIQNYIETDVRPRLTAIYAKTATLIKTNADLVKTNAEMYYKKISELVLFYKDLVDSWYLHNKQKSLKMLYLDAKTILMYQYEMEMDQFKIKMDQYKIKIDEYKHKMENAKVILGKSYNEVLDKVVEIKKNIFVIKAKYLPIIKEEAESIINQTLRAAVILANETVKAYHPHYVLVRSYATFYFNKGKESSLEMYTMSRKKAITLYEKSLEQMKEQTKKLEKLLKELLEKVKNHPAYEKIINHELVGKATQWLKEMTLKLETQIKEARQKLKELQNHPKVVALKEKLEEKMSQYKDQYHPKIIALKEKLEEKITEYKDQYHPKIIALKEKLQGKINEYKQLLNEYKAHPKVEQLIDVLKQINESGLHAVLTLKEKLVPHASKLHKSLLVIPELVMWKINFFHQYPEECFWGTVKNLTTILETLKSFEWKTLHKKVWIEAKNLIDEITDEKTKKAALSALALSKNYYKNALVLSKDYYKKLRMLPKWIKNHCKAILIKTKANLKAYSTQFISYCTKNWNLLDDQWKDCPLYPIVNHEVWGQLADEFLNHEIVAEVKSAALKAKTAFLEYSKTAYLQYKTAYLQYKTQLVAYKNKLVDLANLKKLELKEGLKKFVKKLEVRVNALVTKFNTLVDETTLEDVVTKILEIETFMKNQKIVMVKKFWKSYKVASAKFIAYYSKVKAIGEKYMEEYKIMWNKNYPKLVEKATLKWKQTISKAKALKEKYTKMAMEMKEKYTVMAKTLSVKYIKMAKKINEKYSKKAMELWNDSQIKQQLEILKKMTVRKTIGEIMALPEKAKTMTKTIYKKAVAKVNKMRSEVNARFEKYVLPYVLYTKYNVMIIFNEINETAVFVYRYYGLKDNFDNVKDYLNNNYYDVKKYLNVIKIKTENEIKRIAPNVPVLVKEYLEKVGKSSLKKIYTYVKLSLKVIHKYMVKADKVDLKVYMANMKANLDLQIPDFQKYIKNIKMYIPDFKKYVILDINNGELVLSIPHYKSIVPSFIHHMSKVGDKVADQIKYLKQQIKTVSLNVMNKTIATTKLMLAKLKAKTIALRQDLTASLLIHKKVGLYLLDQAEQMGKEAIQVGKIARDITVVMYKDAMEISDHVLKRVQTETKKIYTKTEVAIADIYSSNNFREAFEKTKYHYKIVLANAKALVLPYYRAADLFAKDWYRDMKIQYYKLLEKAKPYYTFTVAAARVDWRQADLRAEFRVFVHELGKIYRIVKVGVPNKLAELIKFVKSCVEADTWKLADEYVKTHRAILGKYGRKIFKFYKVSKARVDRAIRIAKIIVGKYWRRPMEVINPYRSVAMVFGKTHVVTFGAKYYDVPTYTKPHCTYLLARDFENGRFTILSQKEHLIVMTPDMRVKIHMNGKVQSYVKDTVIEDLPVQSDSGFCERTASFVTCEFKQGVKITCDTTHFLCTIELSGWHYAKSQGLLGTNNNEMYDEMKLPDGTITESMIKFVNAWEVSGDRNCLISESSNELPAPACNKAPSEQCFSLLKEKTSPYGLLFGIVDPVPFLKACQIDSADCYNKEAYETSHCNATAAYVQMLRLKGIWVPLPKDCVTYTTESGKTYKYGESWVQPSMKALDVVVMISERSKARSVGKQIATLIFNLNKKLNGYTTRYALIGFGGKGAYQKPHHHTPNGNMFNDVSTVATVIKRMEYTGNNDNLNDAYGAVLLASKLQFSPGAARVFLLFNSDDYKPSTWYGPTLDETIMSAKLESNATVLAFGKFNFKSIGKSKVIGQNEKRVYLYPNGVIPLSTLDLPRNAFTKLVKLTRGGMFTNKLKRSQSKITEMAITDTLLQAIKSNSHSCKSCVVRGCRFAGQAIPICRKNNMNKC